MAEAKRPVRRAGLERFNAICMAQAKTSKDFSLVTLGALSQAAGVFTQARSIHNTKSKPYRTLAAAWQQHTGGTDRLVRPAPVAAYGEVLSKIPDPAVRTLVEYCYVAKARLEAEVRLLKATASVVVDMRPLAARPKGSESESLALNPSELAAIRRAVSPAFLSGEGWVEAEAGRIATGKGRTVFDAGFATGLRKVVSFVEADVKGSKTGV